MIRAFLIMTSWLVFMVCNFSNPFNLIIGWLSLPLAFVISAYILETKYANSNK